MFKLSAVSVNLNKAIDNQRTASMFVTLCLAQVTLKQSAPLTVAQCWEMLGNDGEPSKKAEHKQAYNKANGLQKKASRVAKALDGDKSGELWTEFLQILNAIDFTAEEQDFYDIEKFAHKKASIQLDDASDVLALLHKATGSSTSTKTAEATADEAEEGADVADKVADMGDVSLAAKALIEMAQGIPTIKAALEAVAGLTDPQLVAATMAEAWMAERRQLCAKLDSLERIEETQQDKIARLQESLAAAQAKLAPKKSSSKSTPKNPAMSLALTQSGAAA